MTALFVQEVNLSLRLGARYELAIEVQNLVATIHQYQCKYEAMTVVFNDMRNMVQSMLEADKIGQRRLVSHQPTNQPNTHSLVGCCRIAVLLRVLSRELLRR